MAQQNRRGARRGGARRPQNPADGGAVNGADPPMGAEAPFPELGSGEEQLAEAQMALGRPELSEMPDESELVAFEEAEAEAAGTRPATGAAGTTPATGAAGMTPTPGAAGMAPTPGAGALSTRPVARRRERADGSESGAVAATEPSVSLPARAIGFLRGSWRELQRVQWPDRRQVFQATGVVLGFVIVAGAFLGAASFAAQKIVNLILYGHG